MPNNAKPLLNNRKLRLPLWAHLWRGKHRLFLREIEARRGDGARLVRLIKERIEKYNHLQSPNNPKELKKAAHQLILRVSELTDEMQKAELAVGHKRHWGAVYRDYFNAFWPEIQSPLRREIIRQSRKKTKTD
ncbi:MAG: hypothetical protein V1777_03600 [Candidatus Micrarchaeota archaeon]